MTAEESLGGLVSTFGLIAELWAADLHSSVYLVECRSSTDLLTRLEYSFALENFQAVYLRDSPADTVVPLDDIERVEEMLSAFGYRSNHMIMMVVTYRAHIAWVRQLNTVKREGHSVCCLMVIQQEEDDYDDYDS
ncbi:hypothetical protein FOZ60_000397 [Perkinsus olseni]|uniref:Uncharacterized protein n=1 Tax=Perkinsus olseni TaxID=32597 RepID=A0A7J6MZF1_PEROL|nr:hypothetical protein FOZ60_000397 [Perkinsus olseni]